MLGLKIFLLVQTFRRKPFVLLHNFCHPVTDHRSLGDLLSAGKTRGVNLPLWRIGSLGSIPKSHFRSPPLNQHWWKSPTLYIQTLSAELPRQSTLHSGPDPHFELCDRTQ